MLEEAKHQIKLGKEMVLFELGYFLENLKYKMKVKIPKEILDNIFDLIKKQAEEKQKK